MSEFRAEDFINHRYQVVRLLGRGAMGAVYLVEDMIKVHRLVALKVLKSDDLDEADFWSKGEYEALTRLRHPHLARVYDFGRIQDSEDFYIVSEFIRGQDLLTAAEQMDPEEFLDVVAQICRALEYIHTQGYVHFDIKPDNILVTRQKQVGADEGSKVQWTPKVSSGSDVGDGPARVKLIDFGLAERITGTFHFAIKGTFNYVAPEIIRGQTPDKRADLYSLGVTLFQILTRRLPLVDENGKPVDRSRVNWREEVRRPLAQQPPWLIDILLRLLEESPEDRFPSARGIIQALNAGSGQRYEIETAETQVSYLYCSRLVSRRKELNRLREEAEAIFPPPRATQQRPTGDTSVVSRLLRKQERQAPLYLISGEIGVGKSRLFDEFCHLMKMREIQVHAGNCYETSHDAYHPFREIIEQLALAVGLESEVFEKHAQIVRRLCPKLRSSQDAEEADSVFRPDKERLFFIDALARFILDAATAMPCVINVNNLHWADEASIELLEYLVEKIVEAKDALPAGVPLMLVATIRSDESLGDCHRTMLARLREEERIREISVRRFTRPQIAELIHSMLQLEEIPTRFLDRLEERTSGNPLFIVETLKTLQEEGIIARDGESWKIRDADLSRVEIPHGIEAILLRRVRMLDLQHQRILEALSTYDKPMSSKLLERFPELARVNVLGVLRELENRGMVAKHLDSGRLHFAISQPKLREIIYQNIPDERRQPLHGALADSLCEEHSGHEDEILEDLAYHYQHSDRVGKALEWTLRAGETCRKIFAHERAVEHFRHVVRQTEGNPDTLRTWYQTHERIGDIGTLSGDYDLARGSYDVLLAVLNGPNLTVEDRARVLCKRGKVDEIRGEYDRALRCYKEARDLLEDETGCDVSPAERTHVYNSIGWVYVCMGKYDKAMKISVDALRKLEGVDERREHAMIFSTIGSANYFKGNLEQAIEFHSRALEIRENVENIPDLVVSLNNLGDAHLASSEYAEALEHYRQALSAAVEIGDAFGRAMALHNLGESYLALGDIEQAEAHLRDSLKLSRDFKMRYLNTLNYLLRGKLRRRLDELAKAENDLFRALGVFAKQGNRWGLAQCLLEVAALQHQRGNAEEALKLVREALANATALAVAPLEARARLQEVEILRAAGSVSPHELLDRLSIIQRSIENTKWVELQGLVQIERGELLVQLRELDEAGECFRRADELFRELSDRLPAELRASFLEVHHVGGSGAAQRKFREVPPAAAPAEDDSTAIRLRPPAAEATESGADDRQQELLRVASLLQEFGQSSSPRMFLHKVMTCLIQATAADEGFLLLRDGDRVRVIIALNRRSEKVKQPAGRICLEALEDAWDENAPVLAPRILDDPRVQGYEALYRENVSALAILPLQPGGGVVGALYLNNPDPTQLTGPHGSPALMAYQNLLQLTMPRPTPA